MRFRMQFLPKMRPIKLALFLLSHVSGSSLRERDHWGDPGVDGRIMLRWILRKWDVWVWTGLSWLRRKTGGGPL
jgi:hypothetical protein